MPYLTRVVGHHKVVFRASPRWRCGQRVVVQPSQGWGARESDAVVLRCRVMVCPPESTRRVCVMVLVRVCRRTPPDYLSGVVSDLWLPERCLRKR